MQNKRMGIALLASATALTLAACGGSGGDGGDSTDGGGDAETTTFRLAFNQTEQHPQFIAAENLGDKLKEETDGRYDIEVYANETLGTQSDVVNNVSDGSVDMMYIGGPVMSPSTPPS